MKSTPKILQAVILCLLLPVCLTACDKQEAAAPSETEGYIWDMPEDFPISQEEAYRLVEEAMEIRVEQAQVVLADGNTIINGQEAALFEIGEFSPNGARFTDLYRYAVTEKGEVYYQEELYSEQWIYFDRSITLEQGEIIAQGVVYNGSLVQSEDSSFFYNLARSLYYDLLIDVYDPEDYSMQAPLSIVFVEPYDMELDGLALRSVNETVDQHEKWYTMKVFDSADYVTFIVSERGHLFQIDDGLLITYLGKADETSEGTDENEAVDGGDWRTYRGYYDGEMDRDFRLLYCYDAKDRNLVFYLDSDEQTTVATVDMSGVKSPGSSEENVVFQDMDGDGLNEVSIPMAPLPDLTLKWEKKLSELRLMPGQEESWRFDEPLNCFTRSTLSPD